MPILEICGLLGAYLVYRVLAAPVVLFLAKTSSIVLDAPCFICMSSALCSYVKNVPLQTWNLRLR